MIDEVRALVAALPKCRFELVRGSIKPRVPPVLCCNPATYGYGTGYRCDDHVEHQGELKYSKELRILQEVINERLERI